MALWGSLLVLALSAVAHAWAAHPKHHPKMPSNGGPLSDLSPFGYVPKAHAAAEVVKGNARFTVLTDSVIRMEWSHTGQFEDRATQAFVNRRMDAVPKFTVSGTELITISTATVTLNYQVGQPFSQSSLSATSANGNIWHFGDVDTGNLLGTIKSLDELCTISLDCKENNGTIVHDESLHCAYGVISRLGWTTITDTRNIIMSSQPGSWFSPNDRNTDDVDVYFFGHGLNYRQALKDYTALSGKIPLNSRALYGSWFTRWYDYDHNDIERVIEQFERNDLPLDLLVLDMNWHTKNDWTGFSWDTQLYPFPADTRAMVQQHNGLMMAANIHDADGIGNWEVSYNAVCQRMGQDPAMGLPVSFAPLNRTYMHAVEDITLVESGFDFFWIDWQQGGTNGGCTGGFLNPTFITDHVRGTAHARRGENLRDNILARWGGLGNHRYPVGFSGDVNALSWQCMAYQPYFSVTAANVAYGSISHDLVGPPHDHELHVRWMQFGAFSGVMRIHDRGMSAGGCWTSEDCGIVNIWRLPQTYREAIRDVMKLRVSLLPYIYTSSRAAFDDGIPFVHPMYYDHPSHESAYMIGPEGVHAQYYFGDDMVVAPIAFAVNPNTQLATKMVWLPPQPTAGAEENTKPGVGCWYDEVFGEKHFATSGGQWINKSYSIEDVPRFVRCGAAIPRLPFPSEIGVAGKQYQTIDWWIYPPRQTNSMQETAGEGVLYEDDAKSYDYVTGKYTKTTATVTITPDGGEYLNVSFAVQGQPFRGQTTSKRVRLAMVYSVPVRAASVSVNGGAPTQLSYSRFQKKLWADRAYTFTYDGVLGHAWLDIGDIPNAIGTTVVVQIQMITPANAGGNTFAVPPLVGLGTKSMLAKRTLDNVRETPWSNSFGPGFTKTLASTSAGMSYLAAPENATEWIALAKTYGTTMLQNAIGELNGNPAPPTSTPPPLSLLVQLWDSQRHDMCLCGTQTCLNDNNYYQVMWAEGQQASSGDSNSIPFFDYWSSNSNIQDNYGTTNSTTPPNYVPAVFSNGYVLSQAAPAPTPSACLQVWFNSKTGDHMTLATGKGRQWALQNGYTQQDACVAYAVNPPNQAEEAAALKQVRQWMAESRAKDAKAGIDRRKMKNSEKKQEYEASQLAAKDAAFTYALGLLQSI